MALYRKALAGDKTLYATPSQEFSTSGSQSGNTTTNWRIQIKNVEIMYKGVTQYKTFDCTSDFNYLDCHIIMEASREHIFLNASSGDALQYQTLELISDTSSANTNGSKLGTSGVIRTTLAGMTRRDVRNGDVESRTIGETNAIVGRMPGAFNTTFDTSGAVNSTVLDMLIAGKDKCPEFELSLVDL